MADKSQTDLLKIPLIKGTDPAKKETLNGILESIDSLVLSAKHAETKAHFDLWQPETDYAKQDVVRTPTCPNWGFYLCTEAGRSGKTEPEGYGEGDKITDGTCKWVLKLFGGASAVTGGVTLWRNNVEYRKDELVLYNRLMYRCVRAHTSDLNFDYAKWNLVNVDYLPDWEPGVDYEEDMLVVESGNLNRCLDYHTSYDFAQDKQSGCWETLLPYGAVVLDWRAQKEYEAGETVRYGAYLYRAKAAHTAGNSFTTADWELLANSYLPDWQAGAKYEPLTAVVVDNVVYRCKTAHTAADFAADKANWQELGSEDVVLADWTTNTKYKARQLVLHGQRLWRAKTAHTSGAGFSAADWDEADVPRAPDWQSGQAYGEGMTVVQDGVLYRCVTAHTAANFAAEESNWQALGGKSVAIGDWQPNTKYVEKQNVVYGRRIYRAKAAHTSGASFTAAQWELADVCCIPDWQAGENYLPEMAVAKDGAVYRCKAAHTAVDFASEASNWEQISGGLSIYQQGKTYNPGQVVLRNGLLYAKK